MRKIILPLLLALIAAGLLACASGAAVPQGLLPNLSGPWEFIATSNSDTVHSTGIEVALQAGKSLENGVEQPNGQVSATGSTQIAILTIDGATGAISFGGSCPLSGDGTYSLAGSFSSLGGPLSFTYVENGNAFNVTATLSSDGKSVIGTYSSQAGSNCSDSGGITGIVVPKLSGTYVGQLTLPDNASNTVTATLSENSSGILSVNLVATNPDNTTFTLSGPVTGNAFAAQGVFQGKQVAYDGYFEQVLDPLTQLFVPAIYFVNVTNTAQPSYAGTLTPPITNAQIPLKL